MVKLLLERGADMNIRDSDGHTPITFGIADNDEDRLAAISALLNAGADLEIPNNKGATALHVACFQGAPQVAELLLEAGVDANTESTVVNLVKPLDYAMLRPADAAREKIVGLFQARGGQPKISRKGQSEVMIALKARKNNCRCRLSSRRRLSARRRAHGNKAKVAWPRSCIQQPDTVRMH